MLFLIIHYLASATATQGLLLFGVFLSFFLAEEKLHVSGIWGELRGAIAIALVLALPTELPYWYALQAMVFSVVLFSTLVQGTTTGWLLRRLGLAGAGPRG